jgi:hypothetical protein
LAKFPDVEIVGTEERLPIERGCREFRGDRLLIVSHSLLLRENYVFAQSGNAENSLSYPVFCGSQHITSGLIQLYYFCESVTIGREAVKLDFWEAYAIAPLLAYGFQAL